MQIRATVGTAAERVKFFNIINQVEATPLTADTTLVISEQGTFPSLNPFWAPSNWTSVDVARVVFDTLSRVGPDMKPLNEVA